jgi:transcriptional regulator with XRE-family HTH domain
MDVIDADWIRARLTGRHGELKALADASGLTPDKITKILKGERRVTAQEIPRIVAFFAEPGQSFAENAADFRQHVAPVGSTAGIKMLASALCPELSQPEVYRVRNAAPCAGLLAGDLLIVELGMTAQPGDLVIATIADTSQDVQKTLIRRFWPPLLVPVALDDDLPAVAADADQSIGVVASIKAVARGRSVR